MIWIILIVLVCVGTTGFVVFSLFSQVAERKAVMIDNLKVIETELKEKQGLLRELAELGLGLVSTDIVAQAKADNEHEEEALRSEKGRGTIIQSEMEAVDLRLRELEEIQKELENSSVEASREIEMLRARERDLESQNQRLRTQVENLVITLDKIASEVGVDAGAILLAARPEMVNIQEKLHFYGEQITLLNRKYLDLKKAYDALDIEYAQLYEKQSQG
ncbi:MAG: hypothetical protein IT290_06930 [Deltaproteobacteria bacterium]|nr:hypothetical protein [Deltaproteobacteria bacterium]